MGISRLKLNNPLARAAHFRLLTHLLVLSVRCGDSRLAMCRGTLVIASESACEPVLSLKTSKSVMMILTAVRQGKQDCQRWGADTLSGVLPDAVCQICVARSYFRSSRVELE